MKPLLILLSAVMLQAAPPVLQELSPRGAQRGKNFTLYLRGDALVQNARIETTLPASFSRLTLSKDPAVEPGRAMRPDSVTSNGGATTEAPSACARFTASSALVTPTYAFQCGGAPDFRSSSRIV